MDWSNLLYADRLCYRQTKTIMTLTTAQHLMIQYPVLLVNHYAVNETTVRQCEASEMYSLPFAMQYFNSVIFCFQKLVPCFYCQMIKSLK